jgi:protein-S-isoprenylcysteine O-methyltransferase Ste14
MSAVASLFGVQPLPFVWPVNVVFWAVFVWAFAPEFALIRRSRKSVTQADSPDAGSMKVIIVGNQIGSLLAFVLAGLSATAIRAAWRDPCYWTGTGLIVAGSLLRRHCWRVLGEHFTGDVKAHAGQPVIDRGAYRWVRHPSYTAGMVMFLGVGLALGNWLSVALIGGTGAAVYTYRVHVEERALASTLGEPYRRFMATRKRFIPFLF